jgi:hypothetical protein
VSKLRDEVMPTSRQVFGVGAFAVGSGSTSNQRTPPSCGLLSS